ncbi:unnamed protein product [Pieris brassicae]|uniref:Uncharacterized protein n=1 Tax=Pieris brassicae TaxID=7116 RepID=A0A9P0WZM7_PIEBR|nr:unnamed protein product [Pieris brassicae]
MEKRPPDPPDPPDRVSSPVESRDLSSPVFPRPGVKRRLNTNNEGLVEPSKKPITDVRSSAGDVNPGFYSHPSLTDSPKSYHINDKGPFLIHVSCPESDPSASLSIRSIIFGHFLIKYKVSNIVQDAVNKVGRNRISFEFKSGLDANNFLSNHIVPSNNYSVTIPNCNDSRMGLVRGVPADWSMQEFVETL